MLQPKNKQADTFRDQMSLKVPFTINAMDLEQMRLDNIEQRPSPKEYSRDPNEDKFYFTDRRTKHPVTEALINPNRDLKSGYYSVPVVKAIIKEAQAFKVDPNLALAVSLQESNLGNTDQNFGHVDKRQEFDNESKMTPDELEAKQLVYSLKLAQEKPIEYFKKDHKMTDEQLSKYPMDMWKLQSYNGLGKVSAETEKGYLEATGRKGTFRYGLDVSKQPLNMKENPAFAKTVLSLKEQIAKDPDFQRLINENLSSEQKLINHLKK